jgi:hypothetical protein
MLSRCRRRLFAGAATAVLLLISSGVRAHDMPSDAHVQMFVRPLGNHLQVIIRLPLISLLNIDLPKRGEDFLDLAAIGPSLRDAAKATADAVDLFEDGGKLTNPQIDAVQVSLPSDASFAGYESALAHVRGPALPIDTEVVWNQGYFDAVLEYDTHSPDARFALHPYFTMLAPRVVTSVHFFPPAATARTFELNNDPGLVHLNPSSYHAAEAFVKAGVLQIVGGGEYLLFLVCLAIPVRRLRGVMPVAAAFIVACSTTLIASAFQISPGGSWFAPVVAALTAVAIVCMTIDTVFVADQSHRWGVAFGFGLAFGFALAFPLRQTLQLAGDHLVTSVLSFAIGAAIAEVAVLTLVVPALTMLFRIAISEQVGVIVVSALVCHSAWHAMVSRVTFLTTINWPLSDLIEVTRWGTAAAVTAGGAVILVGIGRRLWDGHRPRQAALDAAANGRA